MPKKPAARNYVKRLETDTVNKEVKMNKQETKDGLKSYVAHLKDLLNELSMDDVAKMVEILYSAYRNRKAVYTMGNGGHCNTASHMINDIAKHTTSTDDKSEFISDLGRWKTMCLNDSASFVTGIANDVGFDAIFAEQLKNWVEEGDVVIGISGSGNSGNVLKAFEVAKKAGATTICLAGFKGGKAKDITDLCIVVPGLKMVAIEDVHLAINHMVADELKKLIQNRNRLHG